MNENIVNKWNISWWIVWVNHMGVYILFHEKTHQSLKNTSETFKERLMLHKLFPNLQTKMNIKDV